MPPDPASLVVVVTDNDAALSWAGSPTPYVADYSVFRRSPATGAVFNPAGSPVASGITGLAYADNNLPAGTYDWQVFGRVVIPTVAPTITSPNNTTFTNGTPGSFTVTATGTPTPTLSMTGTLPAGVTFTPATGVLAGTPTASGTFPLVFTAANGTLPNAVQNFTLTVAAAAWSPLSLPNLEGWWDASNAASITAAAGKVSAWADLSGKGRTLSQATGTLQPTTGAVTQNGLNALSAWASKTLGRTGITAVTGTGGTFWVVGKFASGGNYGQVHCFNATALTSMIDTLGGAGHWGYHDGTYRAEVSGLNDSAFHAIFITRNGDVTRGYKDGTLDAGSPNTGSGIPAYNITAVAVGRTDGPTYGFVDPTVICEIGWTSSELTSGDRASLLSYLRAKWGTP